MEPKLQRKFYSTTSWLECVRLVTPDVIRGYSNLIPSGFCVALGVGRMRNRHLIVFDNPFIRGDISFTSPSIPQRSMFFRLLPT